MWKGPACGSGAHSHDGRGGGRSIYVVMIPVHGNTGDNPGRRERHLTVAVTWSKDEAQKHLQHLQHLQQTYVLTAGRRVIESCVVANVAQELWGPLDASRARWKNVEESNFGRNHVMHIAGAEEGETFSLQPAEAVLREIIR